MKRALHDSNQSLAAKKGEKSQLANNKQIQQLEQEIDRLREENESIKNALLGAEYKIEELQTEVHDQDSAGDKKEHLLLDLQKDLENFRD
jgi:cob(I)alamin adenosyltransferase